MKRHEATLRDAGLRVTRQRVAVLEYVEAHPHCVADDAASGVRAALGHVSIQAVYDALAGLTSAGLVRRIQPAGSPTRYETRAGDNHHHVICRGCGRIADVDCAVGEAPCLTASQDHGFEIDEAEIVFWGRCLQCRSTKGDHAGSTSEVRPNLVESQLNPLDDRRVGSVRPRPGQAPGTDRFRSISTRSDNLT